PCQASTSESSWPTGDEVDSAPELKSPTWPSSLRNPSYFRPERRHIRIAMPIHGNPSKGCSSCRKDESSVTGWILYARNASDPTKNAAVIGTSHL
ncbi:uncharacterized protein N7446_000170, partial [Penicillium canescens]|uniref:uncharacterized protein n=1 Tax=Penicillium canescens TaxID=5083 RepID=UPI0026E0B076